ncbi:MAG: diaminopimelate epimerase [Coriobacteriia bacterium]|nr:diaminopimelate epimerase [Coriobacteriia bacterium]
MAHVAFTKMEGLGNDFIVIDDFADEHCFTPDEIVRLCDRHFGIGADGVIVLRAPESSDADARWEFFNADGSRAEMCGNGIRCAARFLAESDHLSNDLSNNLSNDTKKHRADDVTEVAIETAAGVRRVAINRAQDGTFESAAVTMGAPIFEPAQVPTTFEANSAHGVRNYPLTEKFTISALSMGNPHVVIDVAELDMKLEEVPVHSFGKLIGMNVAFPEGVNVGFYEVLESRGDCIALRVWERGCGETLACGTGACAAAVTALLSKQVSSPVTVMLLGGNLTIDIEPDISEVTMTGPAEVVYHGTMVL